MPTTQYGIDPDSMGMLWKLVWGLATALGGGAVAAVAYVYKGGRWTRGLEDFQRAQEAMNERLVAEIKALKYALDENKKDTVRLSQHIILRDEVKEQRKLFVSYQEHDKMQSACQQQLKREFSDEMHKVFMEMRDKQDARDERLYSVLAQINREISELKGAFKEKK